MKNYFRIVVSSIRLNYWSKKLKRMDTRIKIERKLIEKDEASLCYLRKSVGDELIKFKKMIGVNTREYF